MRVLANLGRHLARQRTHLLDVLTGDPELHRITHRRAVLQAGDPRAQVRELLIEGGDQPTAQGFTLFNGLGQHHELGKAGRRQLLIQRQIEAWRTGTDIGHVVIDTRTFFEHRFQAFDLLGGIAQRRTFGQFQVNHQLQASGRREELLGHETEQQDAADEQRDGRHDHRLAPFHTPAHQAPYTLVERCAVGVRTALGSTVFGCVQLGQIR
ncbi:hypothetical protein D3C78_645960 [compost metagenome]